jgi:excisionase family DNA binding protein
MAEKVELILLGRRETAAALGVSLRTVDALVVNQELIPVRIGKRVLFRRSAVERFGSKDHETKPT